jgi:hypothetical protein
MVSLRSVWVVGLVGFGLLLTGWPEPGLPGTDPLPHIEEGARGGAAPVAREDPGRP